MLHNKTITKSISSVPLFAVLSLALVFVIGLFIIGYDQGHIFSLIQGEQAFVDKFLHEFAHDIRHAAGFPCH
jgi:hypothetical protein